MQIVTKIELNASQLKIKAQAIAAALVAAGLNEAEAEKTAARQAEKSKSAFQTFDSLNTDADTVCAFETVMSDIHSALLEALPLVGKIAATGELPKDKDEQNKMQVKFWMAAKKTGKTQADVKAAAVSQVEYKETRLDAVTAGEFCSVLYNFAFDGLMEPGEVRTFAADMWEYFACHKQIALNDKEVQAIAERADGYKKFALAPRTRKYVEQYKPEYIAQMEAEKSE
jgi:hypothetical protein